MQDVLKCNSATKGLMWRIMISLSQGTFSVGCDFRFFGLLLSPPHNIVSGSTNKTKQKEDYKDLSSKVLGLSVRLLLGGRGFSSRLVIESGEFVDIRTSVGVKAVFRVVPHIGLASGGSFFVRTRAELTNFVLGSIVVIVGSDAVDAVRVDKTTAREGKTVTIGNVLKCSTACIGAIFVLKDTKSDIDTIRSASRTNVNGVIVVVIVVALVFAALDVFTHIKVFVPFNLLHLFKFIKGLCEDINANEVISKSLVTTVLVAAVTSSVHVVGTETVGDSSG